MKSVCIIIAIAMLVLFFASAVEAKEKSKEIKYNNIVMATPPGKSTLYTPSLAIQTSKPKYMWRPVSDSTWYDLWIQGPSGKLFEKWYTAAEVASGDYTSEITPDLTLCEGDYTWWIQTWNDAGYGPWSDPLSFKFDRIVWLKTPDGLIDTRNPTFTWNSDLGESWYYLWVNGPSGNVLEKWYKVGVDITCIDGTCSVTPSINLKWGDYTWWVQPYSESCGYGPWSDPVKFSVGKVELASPYCTLAIRTPTYYWTTNSDSTWYYFWLEGPSGHLFDKWYRVGGTDVNCAFGFCNIASPVTLSADGKYTWWIQTWNALDGYGPWSNSNEFYVPSYPGFDEQFSGPSIPSTWKIAYGRWSIDSGQYMYSSNMPQEGNWASIYNCADWTDFVYEVNLWREPAESEDTGIIVRGTPFPLLGNAYWNSGYFFHYSNDGYYSILKRKSGSTPIYIQPPTFTDALNHGSYWNTLKVAFSGSFAIFYINDIPVWSGTDTDLVSGKVGVRYFGGPGQSLWIDYAKLTPIGTNANVIEQVSPEQKKLNEEAMLKYNASTSEQSPISSLPTKEMPNC